MKTSSKTIPMRLDCLSSFVLYSVVLLFILLWWIWPQTFIASDPWIYSKLAYLISESWDFGGGGIFDQRIAVTLPAAFFYKAFGVTIRTTNLMPLLSALIIICTVWVALPDKRSKIIGAMLCVTSIPLFQASTKLYPDIIAAAFMGLSFQLLLLRKQTLSPRVKSVAIGIPLMATSALFVAFLAKEAAYWVLPLWMYALAVDLKSDEKFTLLRRFYLPAAIAGLLLGFGYLLFCYFIWGDPFSRINAVQSFTGQHLWSWEHASTRDMVKRLTISPVRMILGQYGVVLVTLAVLAPFTVPRSMRAWSLYGLSCLLLFWFGSTSFTSYEPLPLTERMTLPLLHALIIPTAHFVSRLFVSSARPRWINANIPVVFILMITGIPFLEHLEVARWSDLAEQKAIEIVLRETESNPGEQVMLLCSDVRSPNSLSFYFKYNYPENLMVVYVGDIKYDGELPNQIFVFRHGSRSRFLQNAYEFVHYDAEIDALDITPIYSTGGIELFKIDNKRQIASLILSNKRTMIDD